METQRIPVADGVELALDTWPPAQADAQDASDAPAAPRAPSGSPDLAPFLLVHGLASNARLWDGVAARLAGRGHSVGTVDLRGHGRSSKPDGPYDVPAVAADLAVLLERVGWVGPARAVVAGQSWGGNVVLELAARRPDLVRGAALVDGGWLEPSRRFGSWEACRDALAPPRLAGRRAADVEAHIRAAHPDWSETAIRGTMANFERRPDGTIAPWLTFERHLVVLRGLWEHHPSRRYADVHVPVLLLPADSGEGERTGRKREEVAGALAGLPRARARWFSGDHDIHAQRPDELAGVLLAAVADGFFA